MPWMIVEGRDEWRVVRGEEVVGTVASGADVGDRQLRSIPLTPGLSPERRGEPERDLPEGLCPPLANALADCLKANGYRGEGVLLGLASCRVAVGEIGPQPVEVARNEQAMGLALEGELPWAAEEFVAGFVRVQRGALMAPGADASGSGREEKEIGREGYLGLAIRSRELASWLVEWERAGVWVQGICSWALLRVQGLLRTGAVGANDLVVIGEENGISLVTLAEGKVAGWEWVPEGDREEIKRRMGLMVDGLWLIDAKERGDGGTGQLNHPVALVISTNRSVCATGLGDALVKELREFLGESARVVEEPVGNGEIQAGRILAGRERGWVDWRRGVLADPHPYRAVRALALFTAIAWLVALGVVIAAIHSRAAGYESLANQFTDQQSQLFQAAMPGQKVAVGVRRRLESEVARLKAERGDSQSRGVLVSTPEILVRGLGALPEAVRVRVKLIEVEGARLTLDCEVRSIADATAIVEALTDAGLEVAAPRTELVNGVVPLRISAEWREKKDQVKAPGANASGSKEGPR